MAGSILAEHQPLYSLPKEVLSQIIDYLPQSTRLTLMRTSRSLRLCPVLVRSIYVEPISTADFPTTPANILIDVPSLLGNPFSTGLHERTNDCKDFMSLKGLTGLRDDCYLSSAKCKAIWKSIDRDTRVYVKHLTVPYFMSLDAIRPFARNCPNIMSLDLANLIRFDPLDFHNRGSHIKGPAGTSIGWRAIVKKYPELFERLRTIKVSVAGLDISYNSDRNALTSLLSSTKRLETLELQGRYERQNRSFYEYNEPQECLKLIKVLTSYTAKTLRELRLDRMLLSIGNLPLLLRSMSSDFPEFKNISLSVDYDLKMISNVIPSPSHREFATPYTCWSYIRMIKAISQLETASNVPRWTLTAMENHDLTLRPQAFFDYDGDHTTSKSVELLRWLKQDLRYTPKFAWSPENNNLGPHDYTPLHSIDEANQERTFEVCESLFQTLKAADIPIKLELSTEGQEISDPGKSSFFLPNWVPQSEAAIHGECLSRMMSSGSGTWQWYLHGIGSHVDQLRVTWSHAFLREPFDMRLKKHPKGRRTGRPAGYCFDPRPQSERADEEKSSIQPMWDDLKNDFPHLKRLELRVPALVYLGDEAFLEDVLPGTGWQLRRGDDVVVKDYRQCKGLTPQADVVFLDRTFFREEFSE